MKKPIFETDDYKIEEILLDGKDVAEDCRVELNKDGSITVVYLPIIFTCTEKLITIVGFDKI